MILRSLTIIIIFLFWLWGSLAIYYAGPESLILRYSLMLLFVIALPASFYFSPHFWTAMIPLGIVFFGLLVWWSTLSPSNDKDWSAEVANIPYGTIKGDILTLHNVRNFKYQSETEFSEHWETRTYDLSQIKSLDLYMSYWGSPHIAHTILSWGFTNGDHLAVSIETRKDKSQDYSALKGVFKQFTLAYVAADEKDIIRLRTNFRNEEVYIYRLLDVSNSNMRELLESYLNHMNRLTTQPEFYHALTKNCTSAIRLHTETNPDRLPSDWRLLVNGHLDEMLYDYGSIRTDLPFEQLREQSRIDLKVQKLDADDFSARVRQAANIK